MVVLRIGHEPESEEEEDGERRREERSRRRGNEGGERRSVDLDLTVGWTVEQLAETLLNADQLSERPHLLIPADFELQIEQEGRLRLALSAQRGEAEVSEDAWEITDDVHSLLGDVMTQLDPDLLEEASIYLEIRDLQELKGEVRQLVTGEVVDLCSVLIVFEGEGEGLHINGRLAVGGNLARRLCGAIPYLGPLLRIWDIVSNLDLEEAVDGARASAEMVGAVIEDAFNGRIDPEAFTMDSLKQAVLTTAMVDIDETLGMRRLTRAVESYCEHNAGAAVCSDAGEFRYDGIENVRGEDLEEMVEQLADISTAMDEDPAFAEWMDESVGLDGTQLQNSTEELQQVYEAYEGEDAGELLAIAEASCESDLDRQEFLRSVGEEQEGVPGGQREDDEPVPEFVPGSLQAPGGWRRWSDEQLLRQADNTAWMDETRVHYFNEVLSRHTELQSEVASMDEAIVDLSDQVAEIRRRLEIEEDTAGSSVALEGEEGSADDEGQEGDGEVEGEGGEAHREGEGEGLIEGELDLDIRASTVQQLVNQGLVRFDGQTIVGAEPTRTVTRGEETYHFFAHSVESVEQPIERTGGDWPKAFGVTVEVWTCLYRGTNDEDEEVYELVERRTVSGMVRVDETGSTVRIVVSRLIPRRRGGGGRKEILSGV